MSFPRYPSYKDSGVEWLGDVPGHWDVKRLRFVAALNPSKAEVSSLDRETLVSFLPMDAIGEDGSLRLDIEKPINELESGYTYFRDGDVAVAKITPCYENGKGALMQGLLNGIGFGTTELIVARPKPEQVTGTYLHYLFISPDFRALGESHMYGAGGQKRVPDAFVRDFATAFPPLPEQTQIAAFLDRETAKIDALVAEQRRLMDLLREKRQAVISHAVTQGLNPDTPMKSSGVEWLGHVPCHWEVTRVANVFREVADAGTDELPILSVSIHHGVSDKEMDEEEMDRKVTRSDDRSKYKRVATGDLVYNMMRAWQGGFGTVTVEGMVSPAYVVARPKMEIVTAYVEHLLRTPKAIEQMRRHSRGITDFRLRLYWDEFKNLELAIPPQQETIQICAKIAGMEQQFSTLSAECEQSIGLLQERRTALISAAVTGQIDVRGVAQSHELETIE
jgi:type I restriction enzyme S subunit